MCHAEHLAAAACQARQGNPLFYTNNRLWALCMLLKFTFYLTKQRVVVIRLQSNSRNTSGTRFHIKWALPILIWAGSSETHFSAWFLISKCWPFLTPDITSPLLSQPLCMWAISNVDLFSITKYLAELIFVKLTAHFSWPAHWFVYPRHTSSLLY